MSTPGYPEDRKRILWRSAFRFAAPRLFLPRLTLYADRLELTGWQLAGRFHYVIELRDVEAVRFIRDDVLILECDGDGQLRLLLDDAADWRERLLRQKTIIDHR